MSVRRDRGRFGFALKVILCLGGIMTLAGCSAQTTTTPADWRTDCVGRMQLSFPGEVDVAANSFKMLEAEYKVRTQQPRFVFEDEEEAGYSSQHYLGLVFVSHPLSSLQRDQLLAAAKEGGRRAEAYAKRIKRTPDGKPLVFETISIAPLVGYADRVNTTNDLTVVLADHVMRSSSSGSSDDPDWARKSLDIKIRGVAQRPIGKLPQSEGVCLPYAFIQDDGKQSRSIGATYRLKDHPDVTIWLNDSSAQSTVTSTADGVAIRAKDPSRFTPEYKTTFFWNQRYQNRKSFNWLWAGPHDVRIDNRNGVASYVELKRSDDTVDYGYLVVVRGDPDAKEDAPDLMIYVIRDAKNAIAKGKQPIDKDEFLKLAKTISASVRRRETQ